jgi:hypothetical protein
MTADDMEALRTALPLSDPDRHDLDTEDAVFAHLAPGYPGTCDPADFAASVDAGYVTRAYDGDCAPAFAPKPTRDVETGGAL